MMSINDKLERIGDMVDIKEFKLALKHLKDVKKLIKKFRRKSK